MIIFYSVWWCVRACTCTGAFVSAAAAVVAAAAAAAASCPLVCVRVFECRPLDLKTQKESLCARISSGSVERARSAGLFVLYLSLYGDGVRACVC